MFTLPADVRGEAVNFLIDSGAAHSLLPPKFCPTAQLSSSPPPPKLQGVTGHPIKVHGWVTLPISLMGTQYVCKFLCANSYPILGSDFFADNNLLIDCRGKTLRLHTTSDTNIMTQ